MSIEPIALGTSLKICSVGPLQLFSHLRNEPPRSSPQSRLLPGRHRRSRWPVFFSLLAFDPYRLGWKSNLYCIGIAIVTPFCVEKFLGTLGEVKLVKALASIAFVAALGSPVLLAVIRGDVLSQQVKETAPVVVSNDDPPGAIEPANTFYESTLVLLRVVMAYPDLNLNRENRFPRSELVVQSCRLKLACHSMDQLRIITTPLTHPENFISQVASFSEWFGY